MSTLPPAGVFCWPASALGSEAESRQPAAKPPDRLIVIGAPLVEEFGLHGNEGTEGAGRAVGTVTTGLSWVQATETVVSGKPGKSDLEACWNLGATVAAQPVDG